MTTAVAEETRTKNKKSKKKVSTNQKKSKGGNSQEGIVNVITLDRIVLSPKWTGKLGLQKGDSVRIKYVDNSLILTKPE